MRQQIRCLLKLLFWLSSRLCFHETFLSFICRLASWEICVTSLIFCAHRVRGKVGTTGQEKRSVKAVSNRTRPSVTSGGRLRCKFSSSTETQTRWPSIDPDTFLHEGVLCFNMLLDKKPSSSITFTSHTSVNFSGDRAFMLSALHKALTCTFTGRFSNRCSC